MGQRIKSAPSNRAIAGRRRNWRESESCGAAVLTVITSTFNAGDSLFWTAGSIREQTYEFIQWIIVDGGSVDGTCDEIKRNSNIVDVWFSEPDNGIYDAWNKALPYIKGDWVIFLGAGDEFSSETTAADAIAQLSQLKGHALLAYGGLEKIRSSQRDRILLNDESWSVLRTRRNGILPAGPPHPATFYRAEVFESVGYFDASFRIAGDTHYLLRVMKVSKDPHYLGFMITKMPLGGVSQNWRAGHIVNAEHKLIASDLAFDISMWLIVREDLRQGVKSAIYRVLPASRARKFANLYRVCRGRPPVRD